MLLSIVAVTVMIPTVGSARTRHPRASLGAPVVNRAPGPGLNWVDRVENSTVYFKAPSPGASPLPSVVTPFQEIQALGILGPTPLTLSTPVNPKEHYLLAAARTCPGCGTDRAVYLMKLTGGKPIQFTHPGRLVDPKTGAVTLDSRAFYGHCLTGAEDVYLAFQKERIDRKKRRVRIENSVFIARIESDFVHEELLHKGFPSLGAVIARVKTGSCWEVPGRHRQQSGPIVSLRVDQGDDSDDDVDESESGVKKPGTPSEASATPPDTPADPTKAP